MNQSILEDNFKKNCVKFLEKNILFLKEVDFSNEFYINNRIGHHLRHCRDYIENLISGYELGEINYKKRDRNSNEVLNIHNVKEIGFQKLEKSILNLENQKFDPKKKILVIGEFGEFDSYINSELERVSSHTIHHFSLIKEFLTRENYDCGNMGLAPSTPINSIK